MPPGVERSSASPNGKASSSGSEQSDRAAASVNGIPGKRVSGLVKGLKPPFNDLYRYIAKYMILPEQAILAIVAWIVAAYLMEVWYRFPHLGITSAKMRSAK